jgi:hypothetical protein
MRIPDGRELMREKPAHALLPRKDRLAPMPQAQHFSAFCVKSEILGV